VLWASGKADSFIHDILHEGKLSRVVGMLVLVDQGVLPDYSNLYVVCLATGVSCTMTSESWLLHLWVQTAVSQGNTPASMQCLFAEAHALLRSAIRQKPTCACTLVCLCLRSSSRQSCRMRLCLTVRQVPRCAVPQQQKQKLQQQQ